MIKRQFADTQSPKCVASTASRTNPSSGKGALCAVRSGQPLAPIDVVAVCTNPTLSIYLAGVLQRLRWTVEEVRTVAAAMELLADHRAAVVVCESTLRDGTWADLADRLNLLPMAPALVVVEDTGVSTGEIEALGGFGSLSRPLREADVIWTVASAWHMWMNSAESRQSAEGVNCSGG